jgi:hypothetical protein
MPPVGFKPTISAGERPQTYAFDRAATGTGTWVLLINVITIDLSCLYLNLRNNAVGALSGFTVSILILLYP